MIVQEGKARIYVENVNEKGPGRAEGVFYNRAMVFNRDTTIFLLHNLNLRTALDGLAATGVRGIRIALENGMDVTINDINPEAVKLIRRNVELNGVEARVTNRNVNALMAEERFGYVDIDPFGSPVPFVDMALLSAKILGVTATDTATLAGRNRKVETRYLSSLKSPKHLAHELGVRNLLGYLARMAARYDMGIRPILSVWYGHFYRVYIRVLRGSGRAKETMKNLRMSDYGGPVWAAQLHDLSFLKEARVPEIPTKRIMEKYLELWREERGFLFHHIPTIASSLGVSTPSPEKVMETLRDMGYWASRTQFSPEGVRSDAPQEVIEEILMGEAHK